MAGTNAAIPKFTFATKGNMAMPVRSQSGVQNRLLSRMDPGGFARLSSHLEPVALAVRQVLVAENEPVAYIHFLETGIASMVAISDDGSEEIEVGLIGLEGMTGFHVLHDVDRSSQRTFMQTGGAALRVEVSTLKNMIARDEALRNLLLRYVHCHETQLAHSLLANARYTIGQRLARWLLMSRDRLESDELPLTHEFLSVMLGVRRSGVTVEIHVMEGAQLIKARRGRIRILDRGGLEEAAAGCYGIPETEYERLIGEFAPRTRAAASPD